jgi:hypothetical protein
MGDQALEREPLALEKRYWQAQKDKGWRGGSRTDGRGMPDRRRPAPHGSGVTAAGCVRCTQSRSPLTPSAAIERPRPSRAEVEGRGGPG